MSIHLVVAAALTLASGLQTTPAAPQTTVLPGVQATATAPQAAPAAQERRVCRSVSTIGSNRRERICTTAAERQEDRTLAREYRDRVNSDRTLPNTSGFGGDSVQPAGR